MKTSLLSAALLLSLGSVGQTNQLTLASDVWPPFTNVPGETAVAMEIVKTALNRNSIEVKPKIARFTAVLEGLNDGSYQGSSALWKTAERQENLIFSEPYLYNQLVLVGPKESDVSASSLAELGGKKIAVVAGYAYGEAITEATSVEFVEGKNDQANLLKLLEGEVDYMLVDALLVAYLRSYQAADAKKFLEIGETPLESHGLHFALRRDVEGSEEIVARFNQTISEMQADGTYHRILKLNWIRADVDGDGTMEMIPGQNAGKRPENAYSLAGPAAQSNRIYHNGRYLNWDELPDDVKRTGINQADVQDVTFLSFGL
jgi:polar amino acid transport system substrate-binding protein